MKKTMLALALIASVLGLSACAKYPSVVQSAHPTPAAAAATPAR
jgi:starvation-inducible outer membrane lipoprotein